MPPRDPQKIQADFPVLTQDLIRQLRLTGAAMGLLDFLPSIQPVFLIGDRGLSVTSALPTFASANMASGFAAAPVVNTVIADTGQLPAGTYDIFSDISFSGNFAAAGHLVVEHRNAANAATLAILIDVAGGTTILQGRGHLDMIGYTIALNERLRIINLVAGIAAGGSAAGVIGTLIRTVP